MIGYLCRSLKTFLHGDIGCPAWRCGRRARDWHIWCPQHRAAVDLLPPGKWHRLMERPR